MEDAWIAKMWFGKDVIGELSIDSNVGFLLSTIL